MAKINQITMYDNHNFVNFNDTDSQTDYFHSFSVKVKTTIKWLLEGDGADDILVLSVNQHQEPKYHQRVNRIAKLTGYQVDFEVKEHIDYKGEHWQEPIWHLHKVN